MTYVAAPSVEIRVPLEGSPSVRYFAASKSDAERLRLWLGQRRDLCALIGCAADYAQDGVITGPPGAADWTIGKAA